MGPLVAVSLPASEPEDHELAHRVRQNTVEAQMLAERAHLPRDARIVEHAHIDLTEVRTALGVSARGRHVMEQLAVGAFQRRRGIG